MGKPPAPGPGGECSLRFGRVVRAALGAADQDAVHLMLIGMQQCGAAAAAYVIDGLVACVQDRRGVENVPGCRRDDHLETDLTSHVFSAELRLMRQADNTRSAAD